MTQHGVAGFLKRARTAQPFNMLATSSLRRLFGAVGHRNNWVAEHLLRAGVCSTTLPNGANLRLWSDGDDWTANRIFWYGWDAYEPETTSLFWRAAQRSRCTLDIGAHVGIFGLLAAYAAPSGRVLAIEPVPSNFERLSKNNRLNGDRLECLNIAAGAMEREVEFVYTPGTLPFNPYDNPDDASRIRATIAERTIDAVLREHRVEYVDLVKVDVEGGEPEVLAGMTETLARHQPTLFCEVLPQYSRPAKLEAILKPLGYRFFQLTPDGPKENPRIEPLPTYFNQLFTTRSLADVLGTPA
jgi:FkbM family methyltransferase